MKKLALAPAVAIAITGLAASPVIASPEAPASAPSADAQPAESPAAAAPAALKAQAGTAKAQAAEEAEVSLSTERLSQADFGDSEKGVDVEGVGLEADHDYTITVTPTSGQNVNELKTTATTNADGALAHKIYGTDNPGFVGTYNVVVTDSADSYTSFQMSFEVTASDSEAPVVDPEVSLSNDEMSESEFDENGVKVTGEGFTPGGTVNVVGGNAVSPFATKEVKADNEGKFSTTLKFEGDKPLPAGDYSIWGVDPEADTRSPAQDFTITEDETEEPTAPAEEATLKVSPETITPTDFVNEKKGVTLAVENCEPGEDVRFLVNPKGESSVTAFDKTVKADDEGKANVNVYGTSASNASAYVGDYDVTVTCGDDELTGDFSVEKDANAGGGDGDEDGNGGNDDGDNGDAGNGGDLPRTGTELTGLVGGAGLLLIGGVAVAMTMRRKKVAKDPAEI